MGLSVVPYVLPLAAAACLLAGCGEKAVGGSGRLEALAGGGAGAHLILTGTPYEMGWWHGHLLKDRIRALHEAWQREAFALDGDLLSPATQERRRGALALVEPVLERYLPEAVRQEFQGLSDACGLPVKTLLLTEMITDILRFTDREPRLLVGRVFHGTREKGVGLGLEGPWIPLLSAQWVWITRQPQGGAAGTTLTWPGGLGGVLAARADGLVALAAETPMELSREGLGGVPFRISLRTALEHAEQPASLLAALSRTTGHRALVADLARGTGVEQVVALVGDEPRPFEEPPVPDPAPPAGTAPTPAEPLGGVTALHAELSFLDAPSRIRAAWAPDGVRLAWELGEGRVGTLSVR